MEHTILTSTGKEEKFIGTQGAAVLRTVAYFDVFHYPLTIEQIFQFLPLEGVSRDELIAAVARLVEEHCLIQHGQFYCLPLSKAESIQDRLANEICARKMMRQARIASFLIKQFPFIRAIFITGSLSKNVATSSSDIDFMIVTKRERLWISKTLLTLFRKIFLLGSSKYFCTNFYVSEDGLLLAERSYFSAIELVTTKPIWNEDLYRKFRLTNEWTKEYLPKFSSIESTTPLLSSRRSMVQQAIEMVMSIFPLQKIDKGLMKYHIRYWKNKYSHLDDQKISALFNSSPATSSAWSLDHKNRIERRYHEKLASLGLRLFV